MYEITYILGGNIPLDVQFTHTPGKPMVYGQTNETSSPAEDEEFEIQSVKCNGAEVETDDIYIMGEWIDHAIVEFISEKGFFD